MNPLRYYYNTQNCCESQKWTIHHAARTAPFALFALWAPNLAFIANTVVYAASHYEGTEQHFRHPGVNHMRKHALEGHAVAALTKALWLGIGGHSQAASYLAMIGLTSAVGAHMLGRQMRGGGQRLGGGPHGNIHGLDD